ncbi:MAG: succinylglutamate desuccinylase/aspartoacylase family protein [Spirochaetes bacterium]|nr:succinylglutamate desuccinylase/aspartoacylase family protein [Spirochaetota bacterium]MBU1081600.1 succinylglutamate desuccinylase/aspartoacylase family protein [Spirochaetota bacterium]
MIQRHHVSALVVSAVAVAMAAAASVSFLGHSAMETIVPGPGVKDVRMLSDWFPALAGGAGDTEVYVLSGDEPGGSMLVLGGTHPNEPASFLSALLLIENAKPDRGTLYVIPRTNASGFTHNDPQEGAPTSFSFTLADGSARSFRYGSRATNPIHQWPDPDVYIHASSGQALSGNETRNINRAYPGRTDGTLTERVAYGIAQLIRAESIDLTVDLHEASPEYPVVNAVVAHERAMPLASNAVLGLEMQDLSITLEPSPRNLRGLTHRELGDSTDTLAVLLETCNPSQGRLRGRTDEALVLSGKDASYMKAFELGRLYVPFDGDGISIETRVGRHLATIGELAFALGMEKPGRDVEIGGIPPYEDLIARGVGAFLSPVPAADRE